jgi:hypothetical protein
MSKALREWYIGPNLATNRAEFEMMNPVGYDKGQVPKDKELYIHSVRGPFPVHDRDNRIEIRAI